MNKIFGVLNHFWSILKRRGLIIIAITLICTIIAVVFSTFFTKPEYETSVKLFVGKSYTTNSNTEKNSNNTYDNSDVMMYQNLMQTYSELLTTNDLIDNAVAGFNLKVNPSTIMDNLSSSVSQNSQILEISYKSGNSQEIIPVINAVTTTFIKESESLIPNVKITEIQKPIISQVSTHKSLKIALGVIIGLLLSAYVTFLLEYLNKKISTKEQLEKITGLPILGVIPDFNEK